MNIMLVSVTERTREIGLRMAVGARGDDVRLQFLVEACVLGCVGAGAGLLLGGVGARVFNQILGWPMLLSTEAVALAAGCALGVCVVFGYYPAHRASTLDPMEALRTE